MRAARDEFESLAGVGPSIAADLRLLGVKSLKDLSRRDPERLYARLCEITGQRQDPCVVYVFRCAVYATRTARPDPELLKWWSWKGRKLGQSAERKAQSAKRRAQSAKRKATNSALWVRPEVSCSL